MQRLRLDFGSELSSNGHSFDVPDVTSALVVAEINMAQGEARLHDGDRLVATLEKQGHGTASFWRVS